MERKETGRGESGVSGEKETEKDKGGKREGRRREEETERLTLVSDIPGNSGLQISFLGFR